MFFSPNTRLSSLFLLVTTLFLQSCATIPIYHGPEVNAEGIAVLKVIDKETSISNIDGQATTTQASFAVKGRFEQELTLLPGKHQIILVHGGWREVSAKAVYELEAQKGHTYLVQSKTVGKSTALWFEEGKSKKRIGRIVASFNEPVIEAVALDTYTSLYSFIPPRESGWVIQERTHDQLSLRKEGHADETFVISIMIGQIPSFKNEKEFIDAVEERRSRALSNMSKRYKKVESKIVPGNAADFCYESYVVVEDHNAKRKSLRKDLMIAETAYRTCRHPANPNMATEIYYSHRYYPDGKDLDFMVKAQSVFMSLKYK